MSLTAADEAVRLCEHASDADFVGPRPTALIAAAETALGVRLPPSYRLFVEHLGAGGIGSFEVYGVISEPFDGPIPDAVWATLRSRSGPSGLPSTMIVVGVDGMGGQYVLDTTKGDEPPVEVWNGEGPQEELERIAPSFGAFLLDRVQRAVAP